MFAENNLSPVIIFPKGDFSFQIAIVEQDGVKKFHIENLKYLPSEKERMVALLPKDFAKMLFDDFQFRPFQHLGERRDKLIGEFFSEKYNSSSSQKFTLISNGRGCRDNYTQSFIELIIRRVKFGTLIIKGINRLFASNIHLVLTAWAQQFFDNSFLNSDFKNEEDEFSVAHAALPPKKLNKLFAPRICGLMGGASMGLSVAFVATTFIAGNKVIPVSAFITQGFGFSLSFCYINLAFATGGAALGLFFTAYLMHRLRKNSDYRLDAISAIGVYSLAMLGGAGAGLSLGLGASALATYAGLTSSTFALSVGAASVGMGAACAATAGFALLVLGLAAGLYYLRRQNNVIDCGTAGEENQPQSPTAQSLSTA
jgi:hypothetical protein